MGNSVATGHIVAMTNVHQAVGFKNTLQSLMRQHSIEPWGVSALAHSHPLEKLRKQAEICNVSPFRFISVEDGLSHYSKHAGGWVVQLTREKFTQLSLKLFESKGLKCPAEEAKAFYDVFDSIDMYSDATLSVGELVGGLSTFFAGTLDQRSKAVYNVLDPRLTGKMPKSVLSQFLRPCVWSLVPDNAEVLRPILLSYVADEIFVDMGSSPSKEHVSADEFARWVRLATPNATQLNASHTPFVFAAPIFERCATIIEAALLDAWKEYKGREALREYGQQTWKASHEGQPQRLHDVGMYRYAVSNYGLSEQVTAQSNDGQPVEVPSVVTSMVSNMSKQVQEAMGILSFNACQDPSNDDVTINLLNDRAGQVEIQAALHPKGDRVLAPLPNLLTAPAINTPPPLSSLPAKANGLTRPRGFPEVETAMYAARAV